MRKGDFKQELISFKDRFDINSIRKYIHQHLHDKMSVSRELDNVKKLLNYRYGRYGTIEIENNVIYLYTGDYHKLIVGLTASLVYIRQKMNEFKLTFSLDEFFWSEVESNWDNLGGLIQLLLELENYNLLIYRDELELEYQNMCANLNNCRKKGMCMTFCSQATESQLKKVYYYIRTKTNYWANGNGDCRNFERVFSCCSIMDIEKIRIRNNRGSKAFIRALVETLTNRFDTKIVNLCFCDENGNSYKIQAHDRVSKKYCTEIAKLLNSH